MTIVKIINIKDQKDGTCLVNIDYTTQFPKMVREYYNKKRCSRKMMNDFLIEGLDNYIKKMRKK